jgi:hypothetical protein
MKPVRDKVTERFKTLHSLYWLGHDLLWAITIQSVKGLNDAKSHMRSIPGLGDYKPSGMDKTLAEELDVLIGIAEAMINPEDPEESQPISEELVERTVRLKHVISHHLDKVQL